MRRPDRMRLVHRPLDLQLRHTFRIARGASATRANVLVELHEDGHVGWGEAAPIARYGQDRATTEAALERMAGGLDARAFAQAAARAAVPGQSAAEAAVDMALHDLAGKRLGVPLRDLLGIGRGPQPETSFTIGMDTPEVMAAKAREASAYAVLKVKLGSPDDHAGLLAVREAAPGKRLRVDANEGWTPEQAAERLPWLHRLGVEFVEQPLPAGRIEETRALRRTSPLPFFADESVHRAADVPGLVGAFDGINVKLMKCGGLGEALRLIAVARAHGLRVMLGCMVESSLAITAAAHLGPLADAADLDGNALLSEDPFVGATLEEGRLVLPDGPGLGVRPRAGPPPHS
jgi:L-alanine-DL-glutamate epimerase-like enolase superfamily enzyme